MFNRSDQIDLLTGLPNITYFRSLSQKILDDPLERAKGLVFIYIDIKNFRAFNYYYGFDAGDRCLVKIGKIIQRVFSELYAARFSDDHFAVIAYDKDIEQRLQSVRNQVLIKQMSRSLSIKAGIYVVPNNGRIISVSACDNAKLACENIKKQREIDNCYYSDELGEREELREHIIKTIDEAIKNEYIKVFYQPIVHVMSGRLYGYEGLARWVDPKYGFLSPSNFITTLEDARLINRLDTYMIEKMCLDMRHCKEKNLPIVPVSVNLSALDFQMVDMPVVVNQAIKENGLPHDFLNIEITEAALNNDRGNVHDVLERFRASGFEIWIDNFGSKYSSLNILEDVDVDLLKIDKKFLKNFHTKPRSRSILKNIMNMAKELGLRTLMENVEDEEVLEFLRQTGCDRAQGYLFGKPTPIDEDLHMKLNPESMSVRSYYDSIGSVNLLSQTPLKTGNNLNNSQAPNDFNGIPLALVEYNGKSFKFLMSNPNFRKVFKPMGIDGKDTPEEVFNNQQLQFSINVKYTAQQAIEKGGEVVQDFVTSEGFNNLHLRCVGFNKESKTGALLAVVEQISANAALKRKKRKEIALRFLYSLYNRVDLIKADGTNIENIYLNSSRYLESFNKDSVLESINNFADHNIYIEDRQKFIDFYDLDTIESRLEDAGGNHITTYFRTRDDSKNFSWQMYMMIPIIIRGERYLLSCARSIDSDRLRRLPDINRMGMEYYDMPGNPIFLLLAARAFASTFGYGSFEQFLGNSFYVEANLTDNSILYFHLGNNSEMRTHIYENKNYEEFTKKITEAIIVESYNRGIKELFNREKLLADYAEGKTTGEVEFLRSQLDPNAKPIYFHTVYQMRESNETGDIHAFFLSFNVDDYRRTTEHLIMLIERDALTGLYNRGTVVNLIEDYLNRPTKHKGAFIILDLDNFKQINDRFGHDCGDCIIKDAANRMTQSFGRYGLVARIGGDEFLVFVKDLSAEQVDLMLQNFSSSIKQIDYHDQQITYTMSIGFSICPEHGRDYKTLYQNADMALYSVKMSGRANYREFSPGMEKANRNQLGFSLNRISEGMPGGFLVYRDNESQEILYANKKLQEIYDCESLEEFRKLTGNSFRGCVFDEDWEIVQSTINSQVGISDGYDYVQYRAKTAKGRIIMIEDFGRLVHSDDDGNIFYVFIVDLENKEKIYDKIALVNQKNPARGLEKFLQ